MWELAFWIAAIILIAIAVFAARPSNRKPPPPTIRVAPRSDNNPIRLHGDGEYKCDVVGESHYQQALEDLAGGRESHSVQIEVQVVLHLESNNRYDPNAVRVTIDGHTVGHLPRNVARVFRAYTQSLRRQSDRYVCDGMIVGGWKTKKNEGHFGVKLDLP